EFQESHFWAMCDLSSALLGGFALALDKEEHFFDEYFKKEDTSSSVVLIRYPYLEDYPPTITAPDGTKLSFDWHEDVSLITDLYQSRVENLQLQMTDGYHDIPCNDESFLINAGTYMAHITNNYYHAPIRRVKWINAERQSLPFFVNLGYHSLIEPFIPNDPSSTSANSGVAYGD
ncbi:hypothetical protein BDD12DRAFT_758606, partial [Trichophaea hybrida]